MLKHTLALVGLTLSLSANAATLLTNSSGQLTGALDIDVDGALYDVSFVDGSCSDLFNGCNESSDFTFTTYNQASMATTALFAQVLIDTSSGDFDSSPQLTNGCSHYSRCDIHTPYRIFEIGETSRVSGRSAINFASAGDQLGTSSSDVDGDLTSEILSTYAVWAPSPVPVPAAAWLFGSALIGLVGFKRK